MPSSLPKYSGLITEDQLKLLNQFTEKHEGLSKARALGALLQAWDEAGQPILDLTKLDIKSQTITEIVAREVGNYLEANLSDLVNNLVNIQITQMREEFESLVNNHLASNNTSVSNLDNSLERPPQPDDNLFDNLDDNFKGDENTLVSNLDDNVSEGNMGDSNLGENISASILDNNLSQDETLVNTVDNNLEQSNNISVNNQDDNLAEQDQNLVNNKDNNLDDNSSSLVSEVNNRKDEEDIHSPSHAVEVDQSEQIKQKLAEFKKNKGKIIPLVDLSEILSMRRQNLTKLVKKERKKLPFPDFWDYIECKIIPPKKEGGRSTYQWIIK